MGTSTFSLRTRLLIAGVATTVVVVATLFGLSASCSDARTPLPVAQAGSTP
jgi:hypothetical protein